MGMELGAFYGGEAVSGKEGGRKGDEVWGQDSGEGKDGRDRGAYLANPEIGQILLQTVSSPRPLTASQRINGRIS